MLVLGTGALTLSTRYPNIWLVAGICFMIGAGFGFSAVTTLVAAQSSVSWEERGVVTGTQMLFRSVGQALGAAVLGAVANGVISSRGGNEQDSATMTAAATSVFVAATGIAVLLLVSALSMPKQAARVTAPQAQEAVAEMG